MWQKILDFLKALFTPSPVKTESPKQVGEVLKVSRIPKFGETSDDVKVLQRALVAKGFDPGPIDGLFGSLTKSAVSKFQLKNSMAGSGEPGPQTMMLLGIHVQGTTVIPSTPIQTAGYAPLSWELSDSTRKAWSDYLHARLDSAYDSFVLEIQDIKRFRP
ncbi:MAG: peptidoglycan-binding domain-containing protein, partial [Afipia sp.]